MTEPAGVADGAASALMSVSRDATAGDGVSCWLTVPHIGMRWLSPDVGAGFGIDGEGRHLLPTGTAYLLITICPNSEYSEILMEDTSLLISYKQEPPSFLDEGSSAGLAGQPTSLQATAGTEAWPYAPAGS